MYSRQNLTNLTRFALLAALSFASAFGTEPASAASLGAKVFHWRPFLAPFHAVVLHFPIGFTAAAAVLELLRLRLPGSDLLKAARAVLWLALGSAIVAATFGLMRAEGGAYDPHAVAQHRAFGLSVPGLLALTLAANYLAFRGGTVTRWKYPYAASFAATLGIIGIAGHLGGNLTHGANYLVENAPPFVRDFLIENPYEAPAAQPAGHAADDFYTQNVRPIFAKKCFQCHGSEKHKSGYRLDIPEIALKGGESGKIAIKPGDPGASHLAGLILLPRDSDDVMPPAGKEGLTEQEITTILGWIRDGAKFPSPAAQR